jgi:hypothetical protein
MSSPQSVRNVAIIGVLLLSLPASTQSLTYTQGTGSVGSAILKSLVASGKHSITVLTRNTSNETFLSGVEVAKVDYTSDASIQKALAGIEFLIITLPATAPPDLHSRIVNAAAAAGVKYIMPNYYGYALSERTANIPADPLLDSFGRFINDVRAVSSQGVKFVALVCGFWYEWSLGMGENWYGFDIANRKVTFYGDGLKKINTSTWDLCGEAVAKVLAGDVEEWADKAVYISSFLVSQRDMLDSLHRVLGTKDEDWEIRYQDVEERYAEGRKELQEGNRMGFAKAMYAKSFYPNGRGDYETGWGIDNEKLGLKTESLDEATKRTAKMVENGFGLKTWAETGKVVRAE